MEGIPRYRTRTRLSRHPISIFAFLGKSKEVSNASTLVLPHERNPNPNFFPLIIHFSDSLSYKKSQRRSLISPPPPSKTEQKFSLFPLSLSLSILPLMDQEHAFNNWDLQAVVRGCRSTPPPLGPTLLDPLSTLPLATQPVLKEEASSWCFPDLMAAPSGLHELEELCKSFFPKSPLGGWVTVSETLVVRPTSQPALLPPPPLLVQKCKPSRPLAQTPRSKRRKNQQKKVVCHVPVIGGSSDMWAWRKYGQKPIKGSPYPRGYYRCSSSKGCLARKQVERSRTDPGSLIITYTAEHNHPVPTHRNSLAGSTRQKFPAGDEGEGSSPMAELSPNTPLTASLEEEMENEEEEEGMLLVEDMEMVREDEFLILGQEGEDTGDVQLKKIVDNFSDLLDDPCFNSPWIVSGGNNTNTNTAAVAGAGST